MSAEVLSLSAGPFRTNTYVIKGEATAVVIDPGMHTHDILTRRVEEWNLRPEAIVLTHGHIDHTRDAAQLATTWDVPVYIHECDEFMLADGAGVTEQTREVFRAAQMKAPGELRYLVDGDDISLAGEVFSVRHAPGHSPGSVILEHDDLAFVGDVVFKGSIGRTDLPQSDPAVMEETIATVVLALDDHLALLPGHGPAMTMGQERRSNPFLIPRR